MVYLTQVHLEGGNGHEHIAEVAWRDPSSGNVGKASRAGMVDFIQNDNGTVRVADGASYVQVGVVKANPPYIRTYADGKWSDNLLALPRY